MNKPRKRPIEILTKDEVLSLLKKCSNRAPTGIRNKALIAVLWRSQLRISEALALHPKDVDADACTLRVLHGKGDKARTVGIDPTTLALIARWLDIRKGLGINGHSTLFCTLKGEQIDTSYVRVMLPRIAKKAGILKRVHPHGLRHTGAFELANEGTPMHVIQHQLGHANLAQTATYISHLNPQDVVDVIKHRTW